MTEKELHNKIQELAQRNILRDIKLPTFDHLEEKPLFAKLLEEAVKDEIKNSRMLFPNLLHEDSVAIFSDYSGESKSNFIVYSFLICAYKELAPFIKRIHQIRAQYKLDKPYKEIEYKELRYGPLKASLDDIFSCSDNFLNGLLVSVAVEKSIVSMFCDGTPKGKQILQDHISERGFATWKFDTLEKALRITHIMSYFLAFLTKPDQKLFWMTDNDNIVANKELAEEVGSFFRGILDIYTNKRKYKLIGYATPWSDGKELQFDSILGLADLAAGSLAAFYHKRSVNAPFDKDAAIKILHWISQHGIGLKKLNICLKRNGNGVFPSTIRFIPEDDKKKIRWVHV